MRADIRPPDTRLRMLVTENKRLPASSEITAKFNLGRLLERQTHSVLFLIRARNVVFGSSCAAIVQL